MASTKPTGFRGNTTNELWASMGIQRDDSGVTRDGQACYVTYWPNRVGHMEDISPVWENGVGEPSGPIDQVIAELLHLLDVSVWDPSDNPQDKPDGLHAGIGWIYAVALQ